MIRACLADCLNVTAVKGKILLCDSAWGDEGALKFGAAGTIIRDIGETSVVPIPTTSLGNKGLKIAISYFKSTK